MEKILQKREAAQHFIESDRYEQAYLHLNEADFMFWKAAARNSLEISAGLNSATHQTKYSLETLKLQIRQDISQLNQKEISV